MHRDQQNVPVVCDANEPSPNERPGSEIERFPRLPLRQHVHFQSDAGTAAQVVLDQQKSALRFLDPLQRLAVNAMEGGAQRLVPRDDAVQRAR